MRSWMRTPLGGAVESGGAGGARPRAGPGSWMRRVRAIHFVGIGGAGMGGIAEVLHTLGYRVTGSDLHASAMTRRLQALGIRIAIGHDAAHLGDGEVVVHSTAIPADNPELVEARRRHVPIVPRAQMLAELMRFRHGVAVAGTHGKTTTTSLIAHLLAEGGFDPTYVVGGKLLGSDTNARLGAGDYLVAEADESDASFLLLLPVLAVVTNIDADHMDTYGGDFERLRQAFLEFLHHLPFYGCAVLCVDDPTVRGLVPEVGKPTVTYAIDQSADLVARAIEQHGKRSRFQVHWHGEDEPLDVTLNLPGRHNVLNALAAIAVADEVGVPRAAIASGLAGFQGIARRLQDHGERLTPVGRVTLVDDYGHHPHEIEATLQAVRACWPGHRLVVAFQPHRFTRTRDLFEDFARVLSETDALVLLEIYTAGEPSIPGVDGRTLCRAIRSRGHVDPVFVERADDLVEVLPGVLHEGDVLLTLGAGDIGGAAAALVAAWPPAPAVVRCGGRA